MAFPTTGILDNFNRANEGPPPSSSWTSGGMFFTPSSLAVVSNACIDGSRGGCWGTPLGPATECYYTLNSIGANGEDWEFILRYTTPGISSGSGYWMQGTRADANPGVSYIQYRFDSGGSTQLGASVVDTSGALAVNQKLGTEMIGSTWKVYRFKAGAWSEISSRTDTTYAVAGSFGVKLNGFIMEDFGGGTVIVPPTVYPSDTPLPMLGGAASW